MKKVSIIFLIIILLGVIFWFAQKKNHLYNNTNMNNTSIMKIESSVFINGGNIPARFTCDGEGINPDLTFKDIPKEAKSLALIVDDPDAPRGTWAHWVLWNISPNITVIKENSTPTNAVVGANSWPNNNFGAPCPPSGSHRYFFKLYALDTILNISPSSKSEDLSTAMEGHILAEAELMGRYQKK